MGKGHRNVFQQNLPQFFLLVVFIFLSNIHDSESLSPLQIEPEKPLFSGISSFAIPSEELRLPRVVIPEHYEIQSRPILDELEGETRFTAPGVVKITVIPLAPSRNITLHVHKDRIEIHQQDVKVRRNGVEKNITGQYFQPEKDFYIIELEEALVTGKIPYELEIPYTTILSEIDWVGSYRAYYVNPETEKTHHMSTTKFEPFHARKSFPSFDEPDLKATFTISLARREGYHSLSNSIISSTNADPNLPGWFWDHYETTEYMTTYLICMIVSDFEHVEAGDGIYRKAVKAWAPRHLIAGGKFAANTSAKILNHYEGLFGLEYTFPKMDSIFIPQFPSGAMENWGLNTYREELFMYYDGISTEANRVQVASVLAHELSHQWFGNLVTCAWWSDIWLNEGFASYWMYYGLEGSVPEFDPHNRFYIDSLGSALTFDEGSNTHPIHNSAQAPDEIAAVFDTISYHKAGSILRMVENIFGRDEFHKALTNYLNGTKYLNAGQDDLFQYLHAVKGYLPDDLTIKEILDTWTLQSGYPLVRITKITSKKYYISQEKYVRDQAQPSAEGFWHIPVSVVSGANPDFQNKKPKLWLRKNQLSVTYNVEDSEVDQWLILNADATGFYRVLYSQDLLTQIGQQLVSNASVISSLTRSQLIDNYFNFASAGYASIEAALSLTRYLAQETNLSPWSLVTKHLRGAADKFSGSAKATAALKNYMLPKVENALKLLGLEQKPGDIGTNVIVRAILLDWACAWQHPECLDYAGRLFHSWKNASFGINPIPTDIQSVIYCGAVSNSQTSLEASAYFYAMYTSEKTPTHKAKFLNALACSKKEIFIEILLDNAISPDSGVADSDRTSLIQKIAAQSSGRSAALTFINKNLGKKLLTAEFYANVIDHISAYVAVQEDIDKIQEDINSRSDALSEVRPKLDAAITKMKQNADWMLKEGNGMVSWFEANFP